ncbi:MAG: hypothetical protein HGB10_03970 [Coriobacteriia bacterium]|nr:hypothetical protein [Coriobacteriia bacterium]
MNHGSFLVARLRPAEVLAEWDWLKAEDEPFQREDPVDFLLSTEIQAVYSLYRQEYSKLDAKLNVPMPDALLEYNRWVLFSDEHGVLVAFACFKTTDSGLKLGILATNGDSLAKSAAKRLTRSALALAGVYAEVSGGLERSLSGRVPVVPSDVAEVVLGKPIMKLPDGEHYRRSISNVGARTKIMVGLPPATPQ